MVARSLAAVTVLVMAFFVSVPVAAQPSQLACAPRDAMLEGLAQKYDETPVSTAITGSGERVIITASESGSWTLLVGKMTDEHGIVLCVVQAGEGYRQKAMEQEGQAA